MKDYLYITLTKEDAVRIKHFMTEMITDSEMTAGTIIASVHLIDSIKEALEDLERTNAAK